MLVDQLMQALTLFGLGMGTVFVLLSLLILCVSALSLVCKKLENTTATVVPASAAIAAQNQNNNSQEIAAATAAVKLHRAKNGL